MDIGFTEEQELLRTSARRFLENECPTAFVRQRMAEPAAITQDFWQKLAEQGWFGILYPEEAGGSGLGLVDTTVLMEEMGRAVMPGPFFSTVLFGGAAIPRSGFAGSATGMAAADHVGRCHGKPRLDRAQCALGRGRHRRDRARDGGRIRPVRTKLFVPDAHLS